MFWEHFIHFSELGQLLKVISEGKKCFYTLRFNLEKCDDENAMCEAELRLQSPLQKLSEQVMIEQKGQEKTEDLKYMWLVHPYINLGKL